MKNKLLAFSFTCICLIGTGIRFNQQKSVEAQINPNLNQDFRLEEEFTAGNSDRALPSPESNNQLNLE